MTKQQKSDETQPFEQHEDERGRTVLDRPHTPEEAQEQDRAHAERLAENRRTTLARRPRRAARVRA